jgi:RimJ/RimL family protein N-acetyltransferase
MPLQFPLMTATLTFTIQPLPIEDFDVFIDYLNEHLSDNGVGNSALFQPLSRQQSSFSAQRAATFKAGLMTPLTSIGWRRAWVARDADGVLIGHVDLRSHRDQFTAHRCLLGMGVDRTHRRHGIGVALLAYAETWARSLGSLDWVDLQVLGGNQAALALYQHCGFIKVGEMPDMFLIDGRLHSTTTMCKRLSSNSASNSASNLGCGLAHDAAQGER